MVSFKLLFLSYIPTTLYFSFYHTHSIVMLYLVHIKSTQQIVRIYKYEIDAFLNSDFTSFSSYEEWGARWISGRASDSGARGRGSKPTSVMLCP